MSVFPFITPRSRAEASATALPMFREYAGQTIRVTASEGTYDVSWDEDGHPVKAVRVNH